MGFDVAETRCLSERDAGSKAVGLVGRTLLDGRSQTLVPIVLNTLCPPNQSTAKRCYELGRAIRAAVEACDCGTRIGIAGVGAFSPYAVDEDLTQQTLLKALQARDAATLCALPREQINGGMAEMRSWLTVAGAAEQLDPELVEYRPWYDAAATGRSLGFVQWAEPK